MKKYLGTLVAGMTLMAGLPLVGQAADTETTTKAEVELIQDDTIKILPWIKHLVLALGPKKSLMTVKPMMLRTLLAT
ncbi:hypothetical protein QCD62_08990 [Lactiplantibacillus plantarum]|nr:hypothetical protein [Lactiplantibacillus plantarum]